MPLDTRFLRMHVDRLERFTIALHDPRTQSEERDGEFYRPLCIDALEKVLEHSGKTLGKRLAEFFPGNLQVDRLTFRALFRHAAIHGLLEADAVQRWLQYRDNRNEAAHDLGKGFTDRTLPLLPSLVEDARALCDMIDAWTGEAPHGLADGRLDLADRHRETLASLFRVHLPGVEVWAHGSRVTGRSHGGSDLDLALRAPGLAKIPVGQLADFAESAQDSTLPFFVQAKDWARLPEHFHREITRQYTVLVPGADTETPAHP